MLLPSEEALYPLSVPAGRGAAKNINAGLYKEKQMFIIIVVPAFYVPV